MSRVLGRGRAGWGLIWLVDDEGLVEDVRVVRRDVLENWRAGAAGEVIGRRKAEANAFLRVVRECVQRVWWAIATVYVS